jgi:quinol monooxygenase YgiN
MVTVGVLARFEAKPGNEAAVERFFNEGRLIVQRGKASTAWYAFRLGPTTFGAFAAFADEEARHALLSVGGPVLAERHPELFAEPPTFEMADVLAAKLPGGEKSVTVGFLIRYEVKSGKEAVAESYLQEALSAVQKQSGTMAWYAFRLGPTTFGIFDVFPNEESRQANFDDGAARVKEKDSGMIEDTFVIEKFDVLAARLPG